MNKSSKSLAIALVAVLAFANVLLLMPVVSAAPLTTTSIRLNRMSASTATTFRLVFKTGSAGATSVAINFNGGDSTTWTGNSGAIGAAGSQTDSTASCTGETGATALPGAHTFSVSGSTLTIGSVTALATGTTYCDDLTFASAVTTPNAAGEYHPTITAGSDSTTIALRIVTNDQILVTAVVPPAFNFVLSGNTDTFTANLASSSVVSTSGVTATVNTNAKTGWIAWAKDANSGLTSSTAATTIPSPSAGSSSTLTAGTAAYVLGITNIAQGSGAGTTSAASGYDATASSGVNNTGGGVDATMRQIASSTGTASNAVLTLKERAAISALTPAASDYTDTITVIGAGSF